MSGAQRCVVSEESRMFHLCQVSFSTPVGISFGVIQKFNVLFYLPVGFMAICYPSHGSSSTALSSYRGWIGNIIIIRGGFMTMLNHIISTSHGSLKKVVDHYTSEHASLPPPPLPSARVHQPMDLCIQNVMIMPTPLSTVCHPSDLHGHREPSHICERVVYACCPFFGGRCC
jgi:hypothetical protein